MKRLIPLFLLGILLAGSCHRSQVVMPEFSTVVLDTTAVRHRVPVTFQYSFTSIANTDKSPALQAIEEANIDHFFHLEDYRGNAREAIRRSVEQTLDDYVGKMEYTDEAESEELGMPFEMGLTIESQARVVDSLMVYTITRVSYSGGAHGMYETENHNYSVAGGYELSLSDLFDERQQEALQMLIRRKLYERFDVMGDEGLAEQGVFPEMIHATGNFEVTEDGIIFHYNPYEIAAYAVGGIDVHVTSQQIQEL